MDHDKSPTQLRWEAVWARLDQLEELVTLQSKMLELLLKQQKLQAEMEQQ